MDITIQFRSGPNKQGRSLYVSEYMEERFPKIGLVSGHSGYPNNQDIMADGGQEIAQKDIVEAIELLTRALYSIDGAL